ncbi:unnamed protein product [Phytomonas sp. Hart1]|nr:unnamed protein product [Phytomonas sp. Hart1]|eukprot:CCW71494.1 unnamed protein product [Phytomonas sp. isolate Hart1]
MASPFLLFVGVSLGTVVVLRVISRPRVFPILLMGAGFGITGTACITYVNRSKHVMPSSFVPITLKMGSTNFKEIQPVIYDNLILNYIEDDSVGSNKSKSCLNSMDYKQYKKLNIDEIRHMWLSAVLPVFRNNSGKKNCTGTDSVEDLERKIVFCEIGCEFGNICLQVLAETKCVKTVGMETNLTFIQTAKEASKRAKELYPEIFYEKESIWFEDDFSNCADILRKEAVNTIFVRLNILDKFLMEKLVSFAYSVPSIKCIVTLQKINDDLLKDASFNPAYTFHSSSDWSKGSLFYVYKRQ